MKQNRIQWYGLLASVWVLSVSAGSESVSEVNMDPVSCHMEIGQSFPDGAPVLLTISLDNATGIKLEVLQYYTPFEGIMGNIFVLEFANEQLAYRGPLVKRGPPTDEDWLRLEAGAVLSGEVDISRAWDLSRAGEYSLQLRNGISFRQAGNSQTQVLPAANCGKVSFVII